MIEFDELMLATIGHDLVFLELTDQISQRLQAGDPVDAADYVDRYPHWADAIRKLLPTMIDLVEYGRAIGRESPNGQEQINM
jgi:hypothetical protein